MFKKNNINENAGILNTTAGFAKKTNSVKAKYIASQLTVSEQLPPGKQQVNSARKLEIRPVYLYKDKGPHAFVNGD